MKREISAETAELLYENWPGQFSTFSHMEFACSIPQSLFLISTLKENGQPNLCLHSWSCFGGDEGGYFAVMQNVSHTSHTYENIVRDEEFCINFVSADYYSNCIATITHNSNIVDEFEVGHFTLEKSIRVKVPRIKQAFMTLECQLACNVDLTRKDICSMIIGRVLHASVDEKYIEGVDLRYGKQGFMFNIHEPADFATGELQDTHVAALEVIGSYPDMKNKPFGE